MSEPGDTLDLLDYRRRVQEIYAAVRGGGAGPATWEAWRRDRDALFATHPQTALAPERRSAFTGLEYFPHGTAWRLTAPVEPLPDAEVAVGHSGPGTTSFRSFGQVRVETPSGPARLTLYWLTGYGGGIFLPFRDATNGQATYGGGRYLLDSVKGADLGHEGAEVVIDFNYAYHPSCVHDPRWSCPLAPPENRLEIAVTAGERL